jgi:cytochrome P450
LLKRGEPNPQSIGIICFKTTSLGIVRPLFTMPVAYEELPMITKTAFSQTEQPGKCPVDHTQNSDYTQNGGHEPYSQQKTAPLREPTDRPIEVDEYGVWHVRGYAEARELLRSENTQQAGFGAELMEQLPGTMKPPILFLEGKPHLEQRRQTARFFTPRTTDSQYRQFMEAYAAGVLADFRRQGRADLSDLSMKMAVQVAAQVVGLTDSLLPGMEGRIDSLVHQDFSHKDLNLWQKFRLFLKTQWQTGRFLLLDVRPAIKARQKERREDVISHLLDSDYGSLEILTECVTYGAAGMVTTREFISVVTWHCLENPEYRQLMRQADEETRYAFLHELLRLEPVVGRLLRRTTAEISLESRGQVITIPAGALVDLHIYAINADEAVVGEVPLQLCPGREMQEMRPKAPPFMMSFGDGAHRCPGAYIAIQETDIFVRQLLALDTLRLERPPDVTYNETVNGYEIRNFILTV